MVERELRAYLDCGILARGFARVRCSDCGFERLVAFSCKAHVCSYDPGPNVEGGCSWTSSARACCDAHSVAEIQSTERLFALGERVTRAVNKSCFERSLPSSATQARAHPSDEVLRMKKLGVGASGRAERTHTCRQQRPLAVCALGDLAGQGGPLLVRCEWGRSRHQPEASAPAMAKWGEEAMMLVVALVMQVLAAAAEGPNGPQRVGDAEAAKTGDESMPDALRKLFERELPPLTKRGIKVERETGSLKAEVEAAGTVQVRREGEVDALAIPIGTAIPIQCFVSRSQIDAAGSVATLLKRMKERVQVASVRPVEVVALAGSPALFVEMVYLVDGAGGKKNAGQVKQAVVPHPAHSLMCVHDEPGYAETFRRVVKGLAASLSTAAPDERAAARFAEVVVVRLGEMPVGFVEGTIAPAGDGASLRRSFVALVVPRAPGEIATEDKALIEKLDASGRVVSKVYSKATAGEVETTITLDRAADGRTYGYEGTVQGKKVKGTFVTKDGLASDMLVAKRLPKVLSGSSSEERFQQYSVDANPAGATEVVYRKDAGARGVAIESAGTTVHATIDEHGFPSLMQMPIGGAIITFERIWSRGTP